MKFFAAAAVALAASTASAAQCEVGALTKDLAPLVIPATSCQTATGYTIILPVAMPTEAELAKICAQCTDLITAAKGATFPSCTLEIAGKAVGIDTLFNTIAGQCGGATGGANATANSTAPAASSAAPAATSVAPAASSSAPAGSHAGSHAGSKGPAEVVSAPASSSKAPAATTAAPKSAGVSATLGAAVAVACSIAAFVL
jgi:hypothetical protein